MEKSTVLFISDSKLYQSKENNIMELNSQYYEKYKNAVSEIHKRKEWKSTGSGAAFMGMSRGHFSPENISRAVITSAILIKSDKLIYALNIEGNTGLYTKNPLLLSEEEGYIVRKNGMEIYEIDYNPKNGDIIGSVSEDGITRNLALFNENNSQIDILTEGDCIDRNPSFSTLDKDIIYYDSAGLYTDENGMSVDISCFAILALHTKNGTIEEIVSSEGFDCIRPKLDEEGNLYYIKRPKVNHGDKKMTMKEIIHIPGKVGRALFGWLNFFTQRYSGESLKSAGANPSKAKQKSDEEMFIDGNLINVSKSIRDNSRFGEQHPGIVPSSWQLIKRTQNGMETVVKKGILDFNINADRSILYSNGKHIIKLSQDGKEELICKANLALGLRSME